MNRRRFLAVSGSVLAASAAGCLTTGEDEPTEVPSTQPHTDTAASASPSTPTTPTPVGTRALPSIYVSEILPNPEGNDAATVNAEYVLVEMNAEQQRDLSKFTLEYGSQHRYTFPDLLEAVESGANLIIRSGEGDSRIEGSDYLLFVGSDTPLLANDGMQLTLRAGDGVVVDSVRYARMGDDALWVRPE